MNEADRNELRTDAWKDYQTIKSKLFEPGTNAVIRKPETIKEKFVAQSEKWEWRTLLAVFFPFINRRVENYLHPDDDDIEDFDEDDDYDEYEDAEYED